MSGIYIHIPFCKSRCVYCGFYSTTLLAMRREYVKAVCREAELRRGYISGPFTSVYVGGGTPSVLGADVLAGLLSYIYKVFDIDRQAEVTVECNPDDVTPDFAHAIARTPVNRVSMGVQTFSDARLRFLRRRHGSADIPMAVDNLRRAGISNISIDLMFGFPGETIAEWRDDISRAVGLGVEHISAYSLMYEEGTLLYAMLEKGSVSEIDDELSLAMYDELVDRLTASGYEHYEISNFARPGFRSRHNSSYWRQEPYIGLGAAAHSFDLRSRQWNVADIARYVDGISQGRVPMEREELDARTTFNDIITTALRTREGISLDALALRLGSAYLDALLNGASHYITDGLLAVTDGRLHLTRRGIYVSDMVMADLVLVDE